MSSSDLRSIFMPALKVEYSTVAIMVNIVTANKSSSSVNPVKSLA